MKKRWHRRQLPALVASTMMVLGQSLLSSASLSAAELSAQPPSNDPELAAAEPQAMAKRFYLGASFGVSRLYPELDDTPFVMEDRTDFALGLLSGFHLTQKMMVQFEYANAGAAEVRNQNTNDVFDIDYDIWSADLQYYLWQHENGVAMFAGAGATYIDNEADVEIDKKDNIQLKVKAGLDYALSSDVWLRAQVESFSGDAQILSLGLLKYFSSPAAVVETVVEDACATSEWCSGEDPVGDNDGDGVNNRLDKCPNTYPGLKVDEEGCALFNRTYNNILFAFDSYELTPSAIKVLEPMAIEMKKVPFVSVQVFAHTDSTGTIEYNQWLSDHRAQSIVDYLISSGINPDRISGRGFGELAPVANNNTREGRALNRRAEFRVVRDY